MDIVADIQFVKDKKNSFVPKEIAFVSLKGDFISHWIVSATHRANSLSPQVRKENNWLTQHHHGIDYSDGSVTLNALYRSFADIFKNVQKIYVRGQEKWLLFHKMTTKEVINLEYDTECPSFDNLPWSDKYCLNHALKNNHLKFACALNYAHRIKCYLIAQHTNLDVSDIGLSKPLHLYDEQFANSSKTNQDTVSYCRCVPCGSNSADVDETDCFCI